METEKDYLKSSSPSVDQPEGETTFTLLSSNVNADINLGSLGDVSDSMTVTVDNTSIDQHLKVDGGLSTTQSTLIPENLVLVETSKGLILSVADGNLDGVSFSNACIATMADEHGRTIITSSLPGNIFTQIQPVGVIDDQQAVYETVTDSGGMVSSSTSYGDPESTVKLQHGLQYILAGDTDTHINSNKNKKKGGGWPKGKKRKQGPDVQAPRKPMTGYVIFAVKRRQEIKVTNPELGFSEVTKLLGQEWSNLPHDEKEKYMCLAEEDKQRYISEMQEFQNSDIYQSFLKNRTNGLGNKCMAEDDSLLMGLQDNSGVHGLYCRVCNKYFISLHNKKEHMFGRQHLQNITKGIEKDLQNQEDLQKQQMLMATSLMTSHQLGGATHSLDGATEVDINHMTGEITATRVNMTSTMDVNEFINDFVNKNAEREREIQLLRKCQQNYEEDNLAISKEVKNLEEYENKLDHDLGSLKAYGASLSAQIDALKMVPTVFGVINF